MIPTDDPTLYRRATDGNIVGAQARVQLGPDIIWSPAGEDKAAAAKSALLLLKKSRRKPAAEVPLYHAGLYARADALVPSSRGYVLRETRASTFPLKNDKITPARPKSPPKRLAIQVWVMRASGYP